MWPNFLLLALVNLAVATNDGWQTNKEYIYHVNGRTLTGLHDVANQYSGILLQAELAVRPQEDESLTAKIYNTKYSKIHKDLPDGWKTAIPEDHLKFQDLHLSEEPFQIKMENGVVKKLVINSDVENWEVNIIKSIVSQMQLDTRAQNAVESEINQLPEAGSNNAVYKTMEDTVTGVYETLYDVAPLPKNILASQPWLAPMAHQQDALIEVVKSKNFSKAEERLEYHYGFEGMGSYTPASNQMKDFLLRSSLSRAVISGSLGHYIIQSSTTTNKVIVSPTLNSKKKGLVVSHVNITLNSVHECSGPFQISENLKHESLSFNSSIVWSSNYSFLKLKEKNAHIVAAQKIAQQIGEEIEHPADIPKAQTLAKYVILSNVVRIMSQEEMETLGQKLYNKEEQGAKAYAWFAYRDAIAACGTDPALLTVQNWIKHDLIVDEQAADVIAAVAESTRLPTEKYINDFQKLVEDVQHKAILNDTALLSFATLVRNVYINEKFSNNAYSSNFTTLNGRKWVEVNLIPELTAKLHQAVKNGNSHKILVYIRALGNVGHQRILEAFEPYLEGKTHCSQFQRLQMVVALDKLVKTQPKVARSVLYKIYQNQGELQRLRVAAVYQLMRCKPTAAMLQRMAEYTNIDTDEQVNAAVVSAINSAAQMKTKEFAKLKSYARAAQPLLTTQKYGAHYSGDYLRDYVQEEMKLSYKQTVQVYGRYLNVIPSGIKYAFRVGLGGIRRQFCIAQAMANIDDDEDFENEQLEGNVLLQLAGGVTRFFTFDSQSYSNVTQQYEQELREGKHFQYTKFLNPYESAVSFLTEMGMPFFFTLDAPTLLHVQGQIRANAEPKAFIKDTINPPHNITAQTEINAVISTKVQAKFGFITVFDNQQYISGYDKNMQVQIPIKSKFEIDMRTGKIKAQLQAIAPEKNVQLLHYSSWPYTSQHNMLQFEPVANNQHTQIIYSEEGMQTQWNGVVGNETGMAFRVEYASEQKFLDAYWLYEQYQRNDAISALLALVYDESIMHTKLNVYYDGEHSISRQVQIHVGYGYTHRTKPGEEPRILSQFSEDSKARIRKMSGRVSLSSSNPEVYTYDAIVEFDGPEQVRYIATLTTSTLGEIEFNGHVFYLANVAYLYLAKKSSNKHIKPYEIEAFAEADVPNVNKHYNYDPTTNAYVVISIANVKLKINAKLEQSENLRQYIKNHPRAEECRYEMKQGNQQHPACANIIQEANLFDHASVEINFENLSAQDRNATKKMYDVLRYLTYFNFEENIVNASRPETADGEDKLDLLVRFEPDFESVNVDFQANRLDVRIENIRVNNWVKQVITDHPFFVLDSHVMCNVMLYDTFKPYCVIDQSAANTFDNKTYPVELGNDWNVMMHYVTDYNRTSQEEKSYQEQQIEYEREEYSVLVRDSSKGEKEVKLLIDTSGRIIEIELKPDQAIYVNVNDYPTDWLQVDHVPNRNVRFGAQVSRRVFIGRLRTMDYLHDQRSIKLQHGLVQMYVLSDGALKIKVKNSFNIIYDVKHVKIDEIRLSSVSGLCGTFTGEKFDDSLPSKYCIAADRDDFVQSHTLNRNYTHIQYTNVISDVDIGRTPLNEHSERAAHEDICTKLQVRHVKHAGQICFTRRPLPVCLKGCNEGELVEKLVDVHCVQDSEIARLWQKQIAKGVGPDFSQKPVTNSLRVRVPDSCYKA